MIACVKLCCNITCLHNMFTFINCSILCSKLNGFCFEILMRFSPVTSCPALSLAARAQKQMSIAARLSPNSANKCVINLQYQVFHKCNSLLKKEIFFLPILHLLCLSICSLPSFLSIFSVTFKHVVTTGLINLQGDAACRLRT